VRPPSYKFVYEPTIIISARIYVGFPISCRWLAQKHSLSTKGTRVLLLSSIANSPWQSFDSDDAIGCLRYAAIWVLAIAWQSSCVRQLSYHKSTKNPIKSLLLRWLNHHVPVVFRFGTSHHWCPSMSLRTRLTGRPLHRWFCRCCGRSSLGDTVGG